MLSRICAVLSVWAAIAGLAHAQPNSTITDGFTPPGTAPGSPAGSYQLSNIDTVSLFSGKVNFLLPIHTVKGRGEASHTVSLQIQRNWRIDTTYNSSGGILSEVANDGWWRYFAPYSPGTVAARTAVEVSHIDGPNGNCWIVTSALTRLTVIASDGTEVELIDAKTNGKPISKPNTTSCEAETFDGRGRVFRAVDGSGLTFVTSNAMVDNDYFFYSERDESYEKAVSGNLYGRDGSRTEFV